MGQVNPVEHQEPLWVSPPPPEQLRQLDFLLGSIECIGEPQAPEVSESGEPIVLLTDAAPTLAGHFLQMDVVWPGTLAGRWLFGWNPVDANFISYYIADSGSHGSATSPGWEDGRLTFTGGYTIAVENTHPVMRDVFIPIDDDHFVIEESAEVDGQWIPLVTFSCTRTRRFDGDLP
ncbi:hypothetical protein [Actinomadura sp. 3N508]|uniref:hypothetical protein n=1 Tax=Actinomadura sp. 3N508 TaxID=3375153 RepID=UPI0037BE0EDC